MEIGYLLIKFLLSLVKWITFPIRKLGHCFEKKRIVPNTEDPILLHSATKLARLIREKKLNSETITKAYIQRIKSVNEIINAVVEDRFVEALEEAKDVDMFIAKTQLTIEELASGKPLLGVPITIKESCAVKGLSLVVGSTFMKGTKAEEDGTAVSRLKEAGAIILLVSTTSELCLSVECHNLVTGTTRNPYDSTRTSGGSSGGEAALIGCGASIAGIGSDLAGSIRIPAMFCGIFGHKPTSRLVPCQGHWPSCPDKRFLDYITIGPLTRYAEDLRLMAKVLSDPGDVNFDEVVNLDNTTLWYMDDIGFCFGTSRVQGEIKSAVRAAVDYLKEAYAMKISETKLQELADLDGSCMFALVDLEDKIVPLQDLKRPEVSYSVVGQLLSHLLCFCEPKVTLPNAIYCFVVNKFNAFMRKSQHEKHYKSLNRFREKIINILGDQGVIIMPTYPISAFKHSEGLWNIMNLATFGLPINILGLPSTQVPMGFDKEGMPIGVQVISTRNQDNLCLKIAEVLEKRFGGWKPRFDFE